MHSVPKVLKFVFPALLVGACLGVLSKYSDALVAKLSIILPLMVADDLDSEWFFGGSWKGEVAFWFTLVLQWTLLGWLVFIVGSSIVRKKKAGDVVPQPTNEEKAQQGARANDHGCHEPCSEQHGSRQPWSWLIFDVRHSMTTTSRTIPEGLDLVSAPHGITVRKVWLTWKILPLAGFALVWDTFMFFWYSQVLSKPSPPFIAVFFPIGHVAVGIGLTYYVVAALVNRTDVVISPSVIRVYSGPAPWFGNKEVQVEDIAAIIVRERSGNRGRKTYNVMYADRAQKERKLVSRLSESDQAEYIAEMIRDTLSLRPQNA